jgi:outer membrane protein
MDSIYYLRNPYRLCLAVFGLLALTLGHAQTESAQEPAKELELDLPAIFKMIEEENFTVLINREAIEAAFQRSVGSEAFLYPNITGNVSQSRQKNVNMTNSSGGRNISQNNRFDAKLVADYPILNANLLAEYRLAQVGHRIAQLSYETILRNIQTQAAQYYFLHLRNLKRLDVIHANIERDRALLDLARNQLEVGVATQIDVTRAESRLANDQIELLRQTQAIRESELNLKRMLNLDPDTKLKLVLWKDPEGGKSHHVESYPLGVILENRYDYKVEQEELEQARLTRKAATWQNFPSLGFYGDYGYVTGYAFDDREETAWSVGVRMSVPIFDGFRIRADRLQADSLLRSREYMLLDKESQIRTEYRLAISEIQTRFDQIALARKQQELGEQELQLARNRFEQGVADNREVVDAQAVLASANDQLVEAIYLYNLSRLNYAAIRGNPRLLLSE